MTSFYKLSGAGNDFLALVEPAHLPDSKHVVAWCRRRQSLGADGLFVLRRRADGAQMIHFNADGGRADLCLNGSRCAVQLACHLGWVSSSESMLLETDAGRLNARQLDDQRVEISLPDGVGTVRQQTLKVGEQSWDGTYVLVGVPHWVLEWPDDLAEAPVQSLGAALRAHPDLGEAGANIHFVQHGKPGQFAIRSFERGVEGETLACGTGTVASVAAALSQGRAIVPCRAVSAGGFILEVNGRWANGRFEDVTLAGDARIVARGELLQGALGEPG